MSFLQVQGLAKRYGDAVALEDVELTVPVGSRTAIVGRSGSGKTTLLRIVAGFETADGGRIVLDGRPLVDGAEMVPAHRRGIGYVPQDGALFPHLSIADNIGFGLDRSDANRRSRILELLEAVELGPQMLERRPHELSGGQQQRVALARALARKPALMLLDEPFSALDTGLRDSLRRTVARVLCEAGIATILVTHDQAEALSFADQVAVMREGRLTQVGPPQELYRRPRDRETATFLGDAIILPAELENGWALCSLGRLAVSAGPRRGAAEIMLRPEQLRLVVEDHELPANGAGGPGGGWGRVIDVEFGGSVCKVAVSLGNAPGHRGPLLLRHSSMELPRIGSRVRIHVQGEAHLFDTPLS
ncbi:iron(III) transport system ATP-binding protein [Azospirillum sp. B510]|uniref:ABC transporter ATP-binding protein n=1 Tax=Azospirillum sp. (strain B510) TaxID=137722 RepID=UPI0001C4BFAC|nr:ABC transporter ATP-binding protein [Azospirillum sp. B510]BAI71246.1 iron(III) transport system ATP-binding protein [Azospirillum sp. B510]